jgi:hypothetical protein
VADGDIFMKKISFLVIVLLSLNITVFCQKRFAPIRSKEDILNEEYCSGLFKTIDGKYFDFSDDRMRSTAMGYLNVVEWLQGRVAGLQIYKTRDNTPIPYLRNQRAAVYVDEVPVGPDGARFVSIADIAMIKIVRDPIASGWRGPGGAILIYTWHGEDEDTE